MLETVKIMNVPISITDADILKALDPFGKIESFTWQLCNSNYSEYILVRFLDFQSSQKLLIAQRIVCVIIFLR